ncbi:hypothetical protein H4R20_000335 [Coemansia guatemalensis]|uniref:Alpha/beta hydrolase fold-3 domain-containing protein n=1 Tax=Coemansia guatemalensis TaxID=2761395 RepID=A0A9W8I5G6_9FUNG|nr:hypothetical protein H4R20_000335 [Coemansia guatemalensis]
MAEDALSSATTATQWLTAVASLIMVCTVSTTRYLLFGPVMASWDYQTQLSRDLIRHLNEGSSPEQPFSMFVNRASHAYWPSISRLLQRPSNTQHARRFTIPAYPLDDASLGRAGIWAPKLVDIARSSVDMHMYAECVYASPDHASPTDMHPGPRDRAILYFHGGAYVAGSAEQYRGVLTRLSRVSGMRVYAFNYRLAPESQYPTQLYDAFCAFRHLRELGYAEQSIIFAGDSAGGNLALALWQLLHPELSAMLLLSPRVDVTSIRPSWKRFFGIDVLNSYDIENPFSSIRQLLLPPGAKLTSGTLDMLEDPFIAPVHANLTDIPTTLVQVGTAEMMLDDIRDFVQRANAQNSNCDISSRSNCVQLQTFPDMFHVFQAGPIDTRIQQQAWESIGAFIESLDNAS